MDYRSWIWRCWAELVNWGLRWWTEAGRAREWMSKDNLKHHFDKAVNNPLYNFNCSSPYPPYCLCRASPSTVNHLRLQWQMPKDLPAEWWSFDFDFSIYGVDLNFNLIKTTYIASHLSPQRLHFNTLAFHRPHLHPFCYTVCFWVTALMGLENSYCLFRSVFLSYLFLNPVTAREMWNQ